MIALSAVFERFAADVRSGAFPEDAHTYSIPDEELAAFEAAGVRPATSASLGRTKSEPG